MITAVSKMAEKKIAFIKQCFELLRKKSSYPLISEGRRICQLNLLTLPGREGLTFLRGMVQSSQGRCCIAAVSHSLAKGGDADGKRAPGASPAFRDMLHRDPCDHDLHSSKSVLTAWLQPKRST